MLFKGIQKTSLIDFPGRVACTLFTGGCNFRCGFCYNSDLVLRHDKVDTIPDNEIITFLARRKKYLDGVCITGGEPTLHRDLVIFCERLKKMGYEVKLDTNGTDCRMLKELVEKKLVDYVAMDIKASPEKYKDAVGTLVDTDEIKDTVKYLMQSGVDYEFRTTVVPGLFNESEAKLIGQWIKGAKRYFLQQFRPMATAMDPKYADVGMTPQEDLMKYKEIISEFIPEVAVRGLV